MLTNQEIFNRIYTYAQLKQQCKRKKASTCSYRLNAEAGDEQRCFVGVLIPDEHYYSIMEDVGIREVKRLIQRIEDSPSDEQTLTRNASGGVLALKSALGYAGVPETVKTYELLQACQSIHDEDYNTENWNSLLQGIAKQYQLQVPELTS